LNLYDLIWKRTIATQLLPAGYICYNIEISDLKGEIVFQAKYRYLKEEGYKIIYGENSEAIPNFIRQLQEGAKVRLGELDLKETQTKPPSLYSEGALVKELKRLGIGRPSTYAYIIYTLLKRKYIKKVKGFLDITPKGIKAIEFLIENFPHFVEYKFTAELEKELDEIEHLNKDHIQTIWRFYNLLLNSLNSIKNKPIT
jgi:DNA topoisomerase I